jgi:hypothetical protein
MKKIIFLLLAVFLISCHENKSIFDLNFKLIPVKEGDYWGYISQDGKFAVNPQFKQAFTFREGLALIKSSDDKYGYIDESGKIVINPQYKYASPFNEGLAAVTRPNEKIEYIDKTGKTILSLDETMETAEPFSEGLAKVKINNKYGYINKDGNIAITAQYDYAGIFLEGLTEVDVKEGDSYKYGYIDKEGKTVIPPQFRSAGEFNNDRALIKIDSTYGFIDKQGHIVIPNQYNEAFNFTENCAAVEQGDEWGFIDKDGKFIINPQFKSVLPFTPSGLCVFQSLTNSKYGAIDKYGKIIINPQYDYLIGFYDNVGIAKQNDKYGLIDKEGKTLVNPIYTDVTPSPEGYFAGAIQSDFFGIASVSDIIYKDLGDLSAKGVDKNMSFAGLQMKFSGLSHDNYHDYTLFNSDGNNALRLATIDFIPGSGFITYGPDQAASPGLFTDTEKVYHDDAPVVSIAYTYSLQNKAFDRKDSIVNQLQYRKPEGFTQEIINSHTLVLYGANYNLVVDVTGSNLILFTYFDKTSFDDFKKALRNM